jgi:hypothetical protein
MHPGATSVLTSISLPVTASAYIPERTQGRISHQNDASTIATIAAIRTTARHELLASKANGSRTTITSSDPDLSPIDHSS